jgi:hypothetical protein
LSTILFASCKGDDPAPVKTFANYTRADVMAEVANINNDAISYDLPAVQNFKAGSIIFIKTSSANYGKLEVLEVDINYNITMNLVVFDNNGAKLLEKNSIKLLPGTNLYDLDDPDMPAVVSPDGDMMWYTSNGFYTLIFNDPAKAYLFKP